MEPTKEKNTHMELQVTKYKDINDKRFRSTQSIETIYYDEVDYPAFGKRRNVEERAGYNEYCDLWREFIELQTVVLWRNKPIDDGVIPRIQTLIEDLKRKKVNRTKNKTELDKLEGELKTKTKYQDKRKIGIEMKLLQEELTLSNTYIDLKVVEYQEYMEFHASLWAKMTSVIEELSKNEYVQGRNQNNSFNIENYNRSLYDMINK